MRVPVIADVHGDLDALRSVLAAIDRCEADQIWCLGDIVGLGATTPVEVVDLVRERCASALAGNHDRGAPASSRPTRCRCRANAHSCKGNAARCQTTSSLGSDRHLNR